MLEDESLLLQQQKEKNMNLSNTLLFRGLEDTEITFLLNCLDATERSYKKS